MAVSPMKKHVITGLLLVAAFAVPSGCFTTGQRITTTADLAPLADFIRRVTVAHRQLDGIVASAETAADRKIAHPDALIDIQYSLQPAFAEELLNRSGGLAGALPAVERRSLITDKDIAVFSIRSWEGNGQKGIDYLNSCREQGWMTILFASQSGRPDDLEVDFFIDNGAPDGGDTHGPLNVIANCLNGWLWVCEYTSAMTRRGRHPGILQSITTPGSIEHDVAIQARETRHRNYPCNTSVADRDLARIYLARVDRVVTDLSSIWMQDQIAKAADLIAERIKSGGNVYVSSNSHIMLSEIHKNNKSPWRPLSAHYNAERVLSDATEEGDLLFWLGFNGLTVWQYKDGRTQLWSDYDAAIRAAGVDFITCFATDPLHADNDGHGALAHIEQPWNFGDAVVPIPFPPGQMAPISGLYQAMIYRMLDEAIAARLNE